MNVPSSVRLGTVKYSVKTVATAAEALELGDTNDGRTQHHKQRILLRPEQAPDCLADTMLHEALHLCWIQGALREVYDTSVEEAIVCGLTPNLLSLIRQNPRLIEFLTGKEEA